MGVELADRTDVKCYLELGSTWPRPLPGRAAKRHSSPACRPKAVDTACWPLRTAWDRTNGPPSPSARCGRSPSGPRPGTSAAYTSSEQPHPLTAHFQPLLCHCRRKDQGCQKTCLKKIVRSFKPRNMDMIKLRSEVSPYYKSQEDPLCVCVWDFWKVQQKGYVENSQLNETER